MTDGRDDAGARPSIRLAGRILGHHLPCGGPCGNYRFEADIDGRHALTIYAGVNVVTDDRLTGQEILYIEDINAVGGTDRDFETTRPNSAYETGIRIGPAATRELLHQIVAIVREDFPGVSRVGGTRTTGARWLNRARRVNRDVDMPLGLPDDLQNEISPPRL